MLNKKSFLKLDGVHTLSAAKKTEFGQLINELLNSQDLTQVIFKVAELDPETCVPQVSTFKLGELSSF